MKLFAIFLVLQLVRTSDIPVSAEAAVYSNQGKQHLVIPSHPSADSLSERRPDSNPGLRRLELGHGRNDIGYSLRGGGPEGRHGSTFASQGDSKRASTDAMKL
jgi:hypothetical protein